MLKTIEILISDIFPKPSTGSWVFVSVYTTEKVQAHVSVRDKNGSVRLSGIMDLEKGGDLLEVDIGDLPPGGYRVCIEILGEQWERELWVSL